MLALHSVVTPEEIYVQTTPGSRSLHERAVQAMPGGTTRTTTYFDPYPLYIDRGAGSHVWDVDGTERLDLICNYTALILGHAHPAVTAAIRDQAERGTAFAAANPGEVALAEEICRRVHSVDLVRFTSSGTEATMFAMRLARAFTGRSKMARCEGGYHGTHDQAEVSTHPDPALAGDARQPRSVADSIGTPAWALEQTVVLPFNDGPACERILRQNATDLAGVIVEPVIGAGGVIPGEPDFLNTLRRVTSELGMLLIFDEIISLRVAPGGAQERFGITPDLTTMGKIIGGGLPVAAFGGRADVMSLLDPRQSPSLAQGGTYNGNPLGVAAGLAALHELTPEAYDDLEAKGERLRAGLRQVFDSHDVAAQVNGIGSLFAIHFTSLPVRDYRSLQSADRGRSRDLFLGLLNNGVLLAPRGMGGLPTVITNAEIDSVIDSTNRVVGDLAPIWNSTPG